MLVRSDLHPAQQLVQACHAVAEGVHHFRALADTHPHFVICSVPDEASLLRASGELLRRGVRSRLFVEPDLGDRPTALCAEPVRGAGRRAFRHYPLLNFSRTTHGREAFPRRDGPRPHPEGGDPMTVNTSRFGHHPCGYEVFL